MSKSLLKKGILNIENISSTGERWVSYHANGTLKISEFPDVIQGKGWLPSLVVSLHDWEEICRLRDFLNSLKPIKCVEGVNIHERETA